MLTSVRLKTWEQILGWAQRLWPDVVSLRAKRLDTYLRRDAWESGLTYAESCLVRFPHTPEFHFKAGHCAIRMGLVNYATHRFAFACALDSTDSQYLAQLGFALARARRGEEALAVFKRAISSASNPSELVYHYARVARQCGQPEKAVRALEMHFLAQENKGRAYRRLWVLGSVCAIECGHYQTVLKWAQMGIDSDETDPMFWELRGRAEAALHRRADAVETVEQSIRLDPNVGRRYRLLANLLSTDAPDKARVHYRNALLATHADKRAHRELAQFYLRRGQPNRAFRELDLFLNHYPESDVRQLRRGIERALENRRVTP